MKVWRSMRYVTTALAILASGIATASDVLVIQMKGTVSLRSQGQAMPARLETKLRAPVEVRTGADGLVTLRQLGSDLNIGPNTVVILPDVPAQRGAVQKIEQQQGRVLYSVDKKDREFRVETRHLVSVVKGTVFSVAVEGDDTQVSLLEGSLEVFPSDADEGAVLLKPNESATRREGQSRIQVQPAALFAPPPPAPAPAGTMAAVDASAAPVLPAAVVTTDFANSDRVQGDLGELMAALDEGRAAAPPPVVGAGPPPQPQPEPQPQPQPQPDPGTVPPSQPEPAPQPQPEPEPAPQPQPEPEPQPEPVPQPQPEPEPEPQPEPQPQPQPEPEPGTPPAPEPPAPEPPAPPPAPEPPPPVPEPPEEPPPPPPVDDDDDDDGGLCVLGLICLDIDLGKADDDDGNNGHGNDGGRDPGNPGIGIGIGRD